MNGMTTRKIMSSTRRTSISGVTLITDWTPLLLPPPVDNPIAALLRSSAMARTLMIAVAPRDPIPVPGPITRRDSRCGRVAAAVAGRASELDVRSRSPRATTARPRAPSSRGNDGAEDPELVDHAVEVLARRVVLADDHPGAGRD